VSAVVDLLDRGVQLGRDALEEARRATEGVRLPSAAGGCGCDIPPPCWYPKDHGEVVSHVCPGGTAVLRLRITNCGPTDRTITVQVPKSKADVSPAKLDLGSMERGVVTVTRDVPKEGEGFSEEALVWVNGCHRHFVRWTVKSATRGTNACHELSIDDCPDYVHHWYDHFYCAHPCPGDVRRSAATTAKTTAKARAA
jgi:hypothetical protein